MSALSELCSTLLREVTQRETFDLPTWMWCWMRFGFFFFVLCGCEGFRRNVKKNIYLLKTLNQNISDLVSVDRLVDSLLQRQLSWRVNALRQFVEDVRCIKVRGISLIWRTDCTDERCMVKAALSESRCGCWQQSVGLGGRRISERGCCYKFSRGSESVAQFVDGRWPDLCAGVLLLGSHQDSPCSA